MLDRMYKEHPKGQAPAALEELAGKIHALAITAVAPQERTPIR